MWSLPNLLRLVVASAAVDLRVVTHAPSQEGALEAVGRLAIVVDQFRLAVVAHARASGLEWDDIARRIGEPDARSLARAMRDDVSRLHREVLFPRRADGDTFCPEWWGLPKGMDAPERLLDQLDGWAAFVGAPLVSSSFEPLARGDLDSSVALLEQLRVDVAGHRLAVLYGGVGAGDSPLPLGVSERDVVEQLNRYRLESDRLSAGT